jgi:hypothetical protein
MKNEGRCKVITVFGVAIALGPNPAKGGGLGRHEEFNGAAEDGEGLRCTWGSGELSTKEAGTMGWGSGHRDGNLGMGTRPDGAGYGDDFLPVGGTRTRPEPRPVRGGYFFPPMGNPMGTQYFTTTMILGCEQVKMCSFCDINYDLF